MADVHVRESRDDDVPAITGIYAKAVVGGLSSWEWEVPTTAQMGERRAGVIDEGFAYLVAELDGAIAGFAYAGRFRGRRAYDWSCESSVYVDQSLEGKGVGRALMDALIADCTAKGYRQMLAIIGDNDPMASAAFHAAIGFEKVGHVTGLGFKHGQWLDWIVMQRPLGDGDTTPPDDDDEN